MKVYEYRYKNGSIKKCRVLSLTSIPENLFANCPNVIYFNSIFRGCEIESIPENLFVNCSNAKGFDYSFSNCEELTSIPENLFAYCPNVISFYCAFQECRGLTSIPEKLFDNCKNVESFYSAFYNCINVTGNVPEVWTRVSEGEKNGYVGIPDGYACYYSVTGANNYEDIPEYWKRDDRPK